MSKYKAVNIQFLFYIHDEIRCPAVLNHHIWQIIYFFIVSFWWKNVFASIWCFKRILSNNTVKNRSKNRVWTEIKPMWCAYINSTRLQDQNTPWVSSFKEYRLHYFFTTGSMPKFKAEYFYFYVFEEMWWTVSWGLNQNCVCINIRYSFSSCVNSVDDY